MDHALNCLIVFLDDQPYQEQYEVSGNNVQIAVVDVDISALSEACWQTCDCFDNVSEVSGSYLALLVHAHTLMNTLRED